MTRYTQHGNEVHLVDNTGVFHESLPMGNYVVREHRDQYYLVRSDDFTLPTRFYGNHSRHAARIMKTLRQRDSSLGVMLSGIKGSGKSLMAKHLSVQCASDLNMPTLIVNEPYCSDNFRQFIQNITQPCVVLFDEFEKVYNHEQQCALLTMFDGTMTSKKLWVITCNKQRSVNEFMINRPGRIHYRVDYSMLGDEFITDYCNENLKDLTQAPAICRYAQLFDDFNFDMLKALVDEMNMHNETLEQVVELINVRPIYASNEDYTVRIWKDNEEVVDDGGRITWYGDPMRENFEQSVDGSRYIMGVGDLVEANRKNGTYEYASGNVRIRLEPADRAIYDFKKAF